MHGSFVTVYPTFSMFRSIAVIMDSLMGNVNTGTAIIHAVVDSLSVFCCSLFRSGSANNYLWE